MSLQAFDSTGQNTVNSGSRVRFRGRDYTVKSVNHDGKGTYGTATFVFEEDQHVSEVACEISVDVIEAQ